MTTEAEIRAVFDQAQTAFAACWNVLANMRAEESPETFGRELLDFQPRLAEALCDLDRSDRELERGKDELVKQKSQLPQAVFVEEIKRLGRYQEAVAGASRLGKTLGDAFAWFFYQNDLSKLYAHLKHEPITEIPTGTGHRGESAFINSVKLVDGHLVLYHGITTILRHGDVSLVDLNTFRVTALGELKSRANPTNGADDLEVMLHLVSPKEAPLPASFRCAPVAQKRQDPFPADLVERLHRQLQGMAESFEPLATKDKLKVEQPNYYPSLMAIARALEESPIAFEACGDGLLLVGLRTNDQASLFEKLLGSRFDAMARLHGIEEHVRPLIDPTQGGRVDNANRLDIGIFGMTTLPGTTPLCWCPTIEPAFIRRVLFQDVTIVTVYNPAHLVRKLRDKGFTVKPLKNGSFDVRKIVGGAEMSLHGFDHFRRLVQEHLVSEDVVVDTMSHVHDIVADGKVGLKAKIPLYISQEFLP